jgi:hypothetical protein
VPKPFCEAIVDWPPEDGGVGGAALIARQASATRRAAQLPGQCLLPAHFIARPAEAVFSVSRAPENRFTSKSAPTPEFTPPFTSFYLTMPKPMLFGDARAVAGA